MNILIVGNMGYVGPVVVQHLRRIRPHDTLTGLDIGYFAHCLLGTGVWPECYLDRQIIGDIRHIRPEWLQGVDAIVNLAAISNDPMGDRFEAVTLATNHQAAVDLAKMAKQCGVRSYVYASSCSVYGCTEEGAKHEASPLDPLTAYARSKVDAEKDLLSLAAPDYQVTCLRFATACGMSDRLRLDLVVNDFVAGALIHKKVVVLSDGTPWRPLINVKDMAKAIEWAIERKSEAGGNGLIVNVGSNDWNCQVRDLASAVADIIPGVDVSINTNAQPDKRSYRVNYDLFQRLAPKHQPQSDIKSTIWELKEGLEQAGFRDPNYRQSQYMRLRVLDSLRERGLLTEKLDWSFRKG
jgi:nucleoside-diphosphate-sugar epimerase